jgi:hypothetical protein
VLGVLASSRRPAAPANPRRSRAHRKGTMYTFFYLTMFVILVGALGWLDVLSARLPPT